MNDIAPKIPIAKPLIESEELQAVEKTLKTLWISSGPKCREFEQLISEYIGVRHAVAVNSGTTALHLALLAAGIAPGDRVIVPAFTCVATLFPIEYIGAHPIPVDIEMDTYAIDYERLVDRIDANVKAVILVHLFGLMGDIQRIKRLTEQKNIILIEDVALGLGARYQHRFAGSFGKLAFLSFHPRKLITTGEGGMVLTNSEPLAQRVARMRNYGASISSWQRHHAKLFAMPDFKEIGFNYKMTDIQAAIGVEQMRKIETIIGRRREIALRYHERFRSLSWLRLPSEPNSRRHTYQSYVCLLQVDDKKRKNAGVRQRFFQHLFARGIASVQGAQAMPTITYFRKKYGWRVEDFPHAYRADRLTVSLPIYPTMTAEEQERVIEAVCSFKP